MGGGKWKGVGGVVSELDRATGCVRPATPPTSSASTHTVAHIATHLPGGGILIGSQDGDNNNDNDDDDDDRQSRNATRQDNVSIPFGLKTEAYPCGSGRHS